jgi:hypothetical protein
MLELLEFSLAAVSKQQISDLERFVADWANLLLTDANQIPEDIQLSSESSQELRQSASRTATPTVAHSNQIVKEQSDK